MTELIKNLKAHHALGHTSFHLVSIPFMLLAVGLPGRAKGPCNAGIDTLMYMPLFLTDLILLVRSLNLLSGKGRKYVWLFLTNFVALVILMALAYIGNAIA